MDEEGTIPSGMSRVNGSPFGDFLIDKYEVSNRKYKTFVDQGGYERVEYWKYRCAVDGKEIAWADLMAKFRDATGRPGPSTWEAGDYPDGEADHPVTGISWYEAAAYAEFVDKDLPTIHHWRAATGTLTGIINHYTLHSYLIPQSNFADNGPSPVGSHEGITCSGAYDMAGNVREWCLNETEKGRSICGGAWNDVIYMFANVSQASPLDRSPKNGLRCVRYIDPPPDETLRPYEHEEQRDLSSEPPVSDAIFEVYRDQFSYDPIDLNARIEVKNESHEDWTKERITFDTAYGGERIIANLFLPKGATPPFQTVIYLPGSSAWYKGSSEKVEEDYDFTQHLEAIVKNGRAVLYPVYVGTYERRDLDPSTAEFAEDSYRYVEFLIRVVKDFKRSVDYLETRSDIDKGRLAYCGFSWGGRLSNIVPAVEDRLKASVVILGGLPYWKRRPEADEINYVSRVKVPTLMLNGRYDFTFPLEACVKPMYELLGTPDEDKVLKLYDTDHFIPRTEIAKETLAWLDRYLGPVK
jgi:dienelactone hydrolase